jgi:hypothetical protein
VEAAVSAYAQDARIIVNLVKGSSAACIQNFSSSTTSTSVATTSSVALAVEAPADSVAT